MARETDLMNLLNRLESLEDRMRFQERLETLSKSEVLNNTIIGLDFKSQNPGTNLYYKIATLPISTGGTHDKIKIDGFMGLWLSSDTVWFSIIMGNRDGFNFKYFAEGQRADMYNARIIAYQRTAGEVDIYIYFGSASYGVCSLNLLYHNVDIVYNSPPLTTSVPSGTAVFDSYTAATNTFGLT